MSSKPSLCIFHTGSSLPHILLNEGPARAGGSEVQLSLISRSLAERGWPITIVVCDYGQPDEVITDEGIRLLKAARHEGGLPVLRFFTHTLPADLNAFRAADADIYLEMGVSWHTGVLARECRKRARSFVFWLASVTDPYVGVRAKSRLSGHERRLAHRGLREAALVIAQTREQAEVMARLYQRDCPVIPNIWPATPPGGSKAKPPEVLWAARYLPLKRPELVLEVARRLPDIRFLMAGGPAPGHDELFARVKAAAVELPNVHVLGFVPFADMDRHYASASVYLCTSTIEGFPNTFLQAWNHETPVVSTFDPDGVLTSEGIGVACESAGDIAEAVERMCGDEGREAGEKGRQYLHRAHSIEATIPRLEDLLTRVATRP